MRWDEQASRRGPGRGRAASAHPLSGRALVLTVVYNLGVVFCTAARRATLAICCPAARRMARPGDVIVAIASQPSNPRRRGLASNTEPVVLGTMLVDKSVGQSPWAYHGLLAPTWAVGRADRVYTAAPVSQRHAPVRRATALLRRADAAVRTSGGAVPSAIERVGPQVGPSVAARRGLGPRAFSGRAGSRYRIAGSGRGLGLGRVAVSDRGVGSRSRIAHAWPVRGTGWRGGEAWDVTYPRLLVAGGRGSGAEAEDLHARYSLRTRARWHTTEGANAIAEDERVKDFKAKVLGRLVSASGHRAPINRIDVESLT